MVKYHVLSVGNAGTVLSAAAMMTHAETHVAHDDVVSTRERDSVTIDGDAFARRRLTCHVEVVLEDDA